MNNILRACYVGGYLVDETVAELPILQAWRPSLGQAHANGRWPAESLSNLALSRFCPFAMVPASREHGATSIAPLLPFLSELRQPIVGRSGRSAT